MDTIRVGDIVRIKRPHHWAGYRAKVLTLRQEPSWQYRLQLLRNDNFDGQDFYADSYHFEKVEPEPKPRRKKKEPADEVA